MAPPRGPTVRQQRLVIELRRLREEARLTAKEIAVELGWSPSKLSRIENARIGVRTSDVRKLLELYDVDGSRREEVLALAQLATTKGWWVGYPELDEDYLTFIALEDEADSALYCESRMMPGLLQTPEYARHVVESWSQVSPLSARSINRRVDVRLRRQQLLTRPNPLRISVILDEAALMRCVGGRDVMHRQLFHLIASTELPNVELRILPLNKPRQPLIGESFILLEFSSSYDVDFPDVVHIESIFAAHTQNDTITYAYRRGWKYLQDLTLNAEESRKQVLQIAADYWR